MVKRFIAGAVCPKCGVQDSIRAERDEKLLVLKRECVECGFSDALYDSPQQEIETRVTPPEPFVEVQPLKFHEVKK